MHPLIQEMFRYSRGIPICAPCQADHVEVNYPVPADLLVYHNEPADCAFCPYRATHYHFKLAHIKFGSLARLAREGKLRAG